LIVPVVLGTQTPHDGRDVLGGNGGFQPISSGGPVPAGTDSVGQEAISDPVNGFAMTFPDEGEALIVMAEPDHPTSFTRVAGNLGSDNGVDVADGIVRK